MPTTNAYINDPGTLNIPRNIDTMLVRRAATSSILRYAQLLVNVDTPNVWLVGYYEGCMSVSKLWFFSAFGSLSMLNDYIFAPTKTIVLFAEALMSTHEDIENDATVQEILTSALEAAQVHE